MSHPNSLSRPIIESLYAEALVLADEVRAVFTMGPSGMPTQGSSALRLAISSEGLKTTTRMMHILAWLLNQRAHFSGEMSEESLRRHGRLPTDRASTDEDLALLYPATRELINETVNLPRRIARLDRAWGERFEARPGARMLHERLNRAMMRR